jgi:DNA polymerase I-like protein with 3'-5' exonuclease and polymerase domains
MSIDEAQALIDNFFALYTGLYDFLETKKAEASRNGWIKHSCGRIIHKPSQFLEINNAGIRTLVNSTIQGECAAHFKQGLAKLHWAIKKLNNPYVKIINLVHDATYIECPDDTPLLQKVLNLNKECLEYNFKGVHFSIEQSIKTSMSKADKVSRAGLIYA